MMPEGVKMPQSASPLARAGAGDSAAARGALHATPLKRVHPVHPKRQLFSAPVSKFTGKAGAPSPHLVRIRSCLQQYRAAPAPRAVRPSVRPKAASMEDLTPTKRRKKERKEPEVATVRSYVRYGLHGAAEEQAAARIGRFMLLTAWRRRRDEIRCLRKTLEFQVHSAAEEQAAARIGRFMLLTAWRRRRDEIRCLRKTLEFQVHSAAEEQAAARIGRFMLLTAWRRRRDEIRCLRKTLEFQVHSAAEEQAAARIGRFMLLTAWRRRRDEIRCLRKTLEFQVHSAAEEQAAARIGRFMLLTAWRRRRDEIRCLRKTLEFQVHSAAEEQAAARIGRFMLLTAWRRRRDEIRCLRKTLEFQVHSAAEEQAAARIGRFMLLTAWRRRRDEIRCLRKTLEFQVHSAAEEQAAARIGRFMLLTAWRRRRDEIRCLRKTLEFQVCSSERLRVQVCVLKSLLDSDNAKVRLAMRELARLKQLLTDKDLEKAVLEKEKNALEQDVCAAEDRASEISIGWRNCRNELECERAEHARTQHALALERDAARDARAHCDTAFQRLSSLEEELSQHEELLSSAQAQAAALRRDHDDNLRQLERATEQLELERAGRERCARECSALSARVSLSALETSALRAAVDELRAQLQCAEGELRVTREQLDWWPRPLTKMLGAARSWLRHPISIPEAVLWSFIPARHGC